MSYNEKGDCPLVMVTWEDSRQPVAKWSYLSDLPETKPVRCTTVGWLLRNGPDSKVLAQSLGDIDCDDDMQAGGVMVIPARCVLSVVRLEEAVPVTASCLDAE
jgi:hypothetical protein